MIRFALVPLLFVAVLCSPPTTARSQLPSAERERLLAEIVAAGEQFDADQLPDLPAARRDTLAAVEQVRQRFTRMTDPENQAAWIRYLQMEPLADAIRENAPLAQQARQASTLRARLVGTYPGLELGVLRELRRELDRLLAATRFGDRLAAPDLYRRQLGILAEQLEQIESVPTAEELAILSRILEVLEESGQTDRLLASFHSVFSQPNFVVHVGQSTIQQAVESPVQQDEPVRECILGTRLVGQAQLNGAITVDLLPSDDTARMMIRFSGRFDSRNVGYNGPVRLRTIGSGDVHASRTVSFSEQGFAMEPSQTQASLQTKITAIEHHLKLVRKIASKRAAQQKPASDRIALGRLRDRVGTRFAEQTAEFSRPPALADANAWLLRLDIPEPAQRWSSTDDLLRVHASVSRQGQLGSPLPPPAVPQLFAAALQLHESAVDNALARFLGGRTVNQAQLDQLIETLGRQAPARDLKIAEEVAAEPPFEIDFARLRPIIFEARDNTLRLGVRGTRFEQGGRQLFRPLEITAVYRPALTAEGTMILARSGEVNVDFPGRGRLTVSQTALRSTIKRLFDDLFPELLFDRPLTIPETSPLEALRGREYRPQYVDTRDGWLTVTVR